MGTKFEKLYKMSAFHANPITQDVLDSIKEGDHILIDLKPTLDLLMKSEYARTKKCEFTMGIGEFYTERVAMAFPIGNPWIERINERWRWCYLSMYIRDKVAFSMTHMTFMMQSNLYDAEINGFLGLSLNDRTILFPVTYLNKTVSVG